MTIECHNNKCIYHYENNDGEGPFCDEIECHFTQRESEMFNQKFLNAMEFVLKWEGEYVNDPKDPGGETKYGISKRAFPNEDIKNLGKERAKFLYYFNYWLKCSCHEFSDSFSICIFDSAVNMGNSTTIKLLQRSLNIGEDGIIGIKTLNAVSKKNSSDLIRDFMTQRILYYTKLKQTFLIYGKGWINRTLDLLLFIKNF
jgi:lysozyme family protein